MHVCLLLGPTLKGPPTIVPFTFEKGPRETERNQCFTTGKHILIPKAICMVYPKNEGAQFPSRSYVRTACGWNGLMTKKSHSPGEEVVTFSMPERTGAGPFLPQSPRLMLEPPHRAFHTCHEPFFCLRVPFWFSLLTGSHITSWKTAGNRVNSKTLKGSWRPHFHITFSIMNHWGDPDFDHTKPASSLGLQFFKKSHLGKMQLKAL